MSEEVMTQMTTQGRAIESESFDRIDKLVGPHEWNQQEWPVVRRVIHTTGDVEFNSLLHFHSKAVESGVSALHSGCSIVSDVRMIATGLSARKLSGYGNKVHCHISDGDVMVKAKETQSTRARLSMQKSWEAKELEGGIVAVGNAPTALLEVLRLIDKEGVRPALIVGVPVGFVSAVESKQATELLQKVPWIVSRGTKGGSAIAVAIIHALLAL